MTPAQIKECVNDIDIAARTHHDTYLSEVCRERIFEIISRHLAAAKEEQEWPRTNLGKLLNVMVQEIGAMSPQAFKSIHVTTAIDDADRIADRLERINNENT